MKITGFTIIKNAVINDYPITEAIRSILPIVDEMIVLVGDSTDDTEALIRSINSDKIRIHHSVWDKSLQKGGFVLADETNKAFDLVGADSDWAFYIQGDECIHEKYHASILDAAKRHLADHRVDGLLFNYLHFYGTYDYVGDSRKWYDKEVRLIRNDKSIRAYRDAQGFRRNGEKIRVKPTQAWVYHYGWVKSEEQMRSKVANMVHYWEEMGKKGGAPEELFNPNDFESLVRFEGTHPAVYLERIRNKNWQVNFDISKKKFSFKDWLLYRLEKITGKRLFAFRNYEII
ncbi:glycosyl transferase [Flavihumibacter sp. ZG627]|uniref:glycosyl transferase n=1 Tax=Flavihumibacter sp. ZG627 TaxID=1463156 RepID=UPI00058091CB|nr:glycosyl transferase [Flavihumibacter sp. ZG627]KIC91171.1 glycosyl transferase [Flavihumibacter sp. ZG627]